ncbi:CD1247 N-terminal domain-containing protein [Brevibacillus dissolubilis]|uniref:CD1247 N-terminal domain-containing protein n=1 Tax=Brevibacillus dissolubilis TaxID=1844116 RepID=UPI00159B9870|nr:CD1247 N-terminal domain-containing protein [Brevibacillus dissolubilis]
MEHLDKRISYLRGVIDGMDLDQTSMENRILVDLIDLLDEVSTELKSVHTRVDEVEDYVEAVDEDLSDMEYLLYDDEDDDLYEDVDDDCEEYYLVDEDGEHYYDLDDSEDAYVYESRHVRGRDSRDDVSFDRSYEIECPTCREVVFLHEGTDQEGYHHYVIEPNHGGTEPINPT